MLIWLAMLIPVGMAIYLHQKHQHKVLWWEFLIPFGLSVLLCGGFKALIEVAQTRDTEYWGGWATRAEYYEDWNELVHYTETRTYRDSQGRSRTETVRKTRVDYHPAVWKLVDSNNIEVSISSESFEQLCRIFGNKTFTDLHRDYHTNDGDLYTTTFPGDDLRLVPVTTTHSYENRVAVSDSIINFRDVNPKDHGLFDYPSIDEYRCDSILGTGDLTQAVANRHLNNWNAKLGATKQVRIWILFQDQPLQAGMDQENYWKGGNKNEFVITIGVDAQKNVQWCHPFSWTEVEDLKIDVRDYVVNQKTLNLDALVSYVVPQVQQRYVRKHFSDFSYISIDPPAWAVFLTYLLVLASNAGLSAWIINNQHREGGAFRIARF